MEKFINTMLENIFGGMGSQMFVLNIIFAAMLIIVGIVLLIRKQSSKAKQAIGWICIGIGCLGALTRILLMVF